MPTEGIAAFAVLGLVIGWLIGWALGRGGTQAEKQRADLLEISLKQSTTDLNTAQTSLRTAAEEHKDIEAAHNEQVKANEVKIEGLTKDKEHLEKDSIRAAKAIEELGKENTRVTADLSQSQKELAELRERLKGDQKSHEEKLAMLTSARVELSNQFETLASNILEKKSKVFTEQNQTNIGNLLNPLKEKFDQFQKEVKSLNDSGISGRTELKTQIENLAKLNTKLSDDANNLTTALKGSTKTQGNWGEQVLETILEAAGLRKGYEYLTQESFLREEPAEDGRLRAQPDVLVRLPEDRNIIIDSKVSLDAHRDYCAAPDDAAREAALKELIKSVRTHILGLSKRSYQLLDGINSPDFVVMFVPIEPAFMLAISGDSRLWQEAWDKNVLLVSPSTLLFVLRTVAQLWRQELQAKNIKEIVKRGGELYEKLVGFAEDLVDVGANLDKACASYDEACKKLSTGKGNVIRQAEMLKKLGVKPTKKLPIALVERSDGDEPLDLAASEEPELASTSQIDSQSGPPSPAED